ncbi:ribosomal protein S18-alanine N-acetyltransferase [Aquidulcibacter sp.]|uniref:ribosomal protein S18-alanine N-acetyltransferase n=1 Tax=Aquidulcibacter sp. TaxID=2052990 RepID=UPI0025BF2DDF|nr:ribosomal protein S18-alanine N-acetyltransferase [Aquidulcibacter sp.]MCA3693357.1 ribosomal protein S18-alanine N-acetyltransferase [Aquidulcibacter sp.]
MTLRRAHPSDAAALARIHQSAFDHSWSEADFATYVASDFVWIIGKPIAGFLLVRAIGDEAEILTLAVDPSARRNGHAAALLTASKQDLVGHGVVRLFLEVAADNLPALALYEGHGFTPIGVRKAYYRRENGPNMDAKLLSCALTTAH